MNALVVVLEKLTPFGVLTQFREHGRQFSAELIKKSLEEGNAFEKKDLVSILGTLSAFNDFHVSSHCIRSREPDFEGRE